LAPDPGGGLREAPRQPRAFRLEDELWTSIVFDFACAHRRRPLERGLLLRSLTPLYLARVASFVLEVEDCFAEQVEERIERLCLCFERLKPRLVAQWDGARREQPAPARPATRRDEEHILEVQA